MRIKPFSVIIILLIQEALGSKSLETCSPGGGTTNEIEAIVKGKCQYFINVLEKDNCDIQKANFNCDSIWKEFSQAIVNKDPCQVTIESFDRLIEITRHPIKKDSSLFWSGTYKLAHLSMI